MRLTLPQQDVYFEQLMYPDDPIYNIGAKIAIKGNISYKLLNEAYVALINQHDAYRSVIDQSGEEALININEGHDSLLGFADFSAFENADEAANKFMQDEFRIPFKLDKDGLLHKFILLKISETDHYLFSVYHHIITDGWGTSLMFQRLVKNYNELVEHGKVVTAYPFTYQDFVSDDLAYFLSQDFQKDKLYWVEKFKQLPDPLFDKISNAGKPNQSERKEIWIKRADYDQLDQIGKNLRCSTFHVILGILFLYFGRKHQKNDLVIGLPVLNRGKSIFKKTVGLFMGVSPLRMQFDLNDSFEELVKNIRQQLQQDYRYQRFPLGKLIKELELYQERDRLFNITLSYEKQNYADHFINTGTQVIPLSHQSERVALAVYIREFDESAAVKIDFDYNLNYFDDPSISRVVAHFQTLVSAVITDPRMRLSAYQYITEEEKERLLKEFNDTAFKYRSDLSLVDLFREQVRLDPDKIALRDEMRAYTYNELDAASDKVAAYLRKNTRNGQAPIIGVMMPRSADLVTTLLGILKSGSAYIPLDPSFPKERLEYIIAHSGMQEIIGTREFNEQPVLNEGVATIEAILENRKELVGEWELSPAAVAYVIYTSGSTGNPKGVAVSHRSLLNFLISMQHRPGIKPNDLLFSVTTQSFDISILEFFLPLISGATVYIASQDLLADPLNLIVKLDELKPAIIQGTPGFYQMLYNAGWQGSKSTKILCGGDLLSEVLAGKLLENNSGVWNMYGPTETTIWSGCKKIMQPKDASNVGRPVHNTEFYILDDYMQLLPVGSVGNIYIGGDGVALGYFKDKDLTEKKFIRSPFDKSKIIYDTGDLGKWNEKGEIEFVGRNDQQVKIRGYRIELSEIEARLNQLGTVKASVVVARKSAGQEAILVAYVIPEAGSVDGDGIIKALHNTLPAYMVPHVIIGVDEFPLTPNKKVDRKALSLREVTPERTGIEHTGPVTDVERALCDYYQEILNITNEVSVSDNFFALGGHSLSAIKLINRIDEGLHYRITLRDIFDHPTAQLLSKYLKNKEKQHGIDIEPAEKQLYYAITPAQNSIWLASQQEERSIAYNMPAAFAISGVMNKAVLEQVFLEMIGKYEILRTNFPEVAGVPRQQVKPAGEVYLAVDEYCYPGEEITGVMESYINQGFDLENEILLRVALFHKENGGSYLVFCTHHIIMDGWSLEILIKEVVSRYRAINEQSKGKDTSLKFQFKDYAGWFQEQRKKTREKDLRFWNTYLQQYLWAPIIPYDNEFSVEENPGAACGFAYQSIKIPELHALAQKQKASVHTLLLAAFNLLLYRMYGHKDICMGMVNSGRTLSALEDQLGMFVKTLPFRTHIEPQQSFSKMLGLTHQNLLRVNDHQDIPEAVERTLRLDVLLVVENYDYANINIYKDLDLRLHELNNKYSRLPLLISISVNKDCLSGTMYYNSSLYQQETIELITMKYEKLLKELITNPGIPLNSIDMELDFEKERSMDINFDF